MLSIDAHVLVSMSVYFPQRPYTCTSTCSCTDVRVLVSTHVYLCLRTYTCADAGILPSSPIYFHQRRYTLPHVGIPTLTSKYLYRSLYMYFAFLYLLQILSCIPFTGNIVNIHPDVDFFLPTCVYALWRRLSCSLCRRLSTSLHLPIIQNLFFFAFS